MHYVYSKQGAANALGLSSINQVNRYKKNAIQAGKIPCKIIGGIECMTLIFCNINQKLNELQAITMATKPMSLKHSLMEFCLSFK